MAKIRMGIINAGVNTGRQHTPAGKARAAGQRTVLYRVDAGGGPSCGCGKRKAFGLFYIGDLGKKAEGFHLFFRNAENRVIIQELCVGKAGGIQKGRTALVTDYYLEGSVRGPIAYRQLPGKEPLFRGGVKGQIQKVFYFLDCPGKVPLFGVC